MLPDRAPIPARVLAGWAKETILGAIDQLINEGDPEWDADDQRALKKERDRVARFLGMPK